MKVFITGVSGLLGLNVAWQLRDRFEIHGCYNSHPLLAPGIRAVRCDLAQSDAVGALLMSVRPGVIINAAGLTSVDRCESDPDLARRLNVEAATLLARIATTIGSRLIHVSTDHLFDGVAARRSESDVVSPLNVYARTKWQAELRVLEACPTALVVRTNFFGWGTSRRESFSDWVLNGLEQARRLPMFDDVFFTPILVNDLIDRFVSLFDRGASGVLHVGGADRLSKFQFGVRLARTFGYPETGIVPVPIDAMKLGAPRPRDMSLDSRQAELLLGSPMPTLDDGFARLQRLSREQWPQALERAMSASAS
jgi:dTDP-4-dehydrorhamnose reductase